MVEGFVELSLRGSDFGGRFEIFLNFYYEIKVNMCNFEVRKLVLGPYIQTTESHLSMVFSVMDLRFIEKRANSEGFVK